MSKGPCELNLQKCSSHHCCRKQVGFAIGIWLSRIWNLLWWNTSSPLTTALSKRLISGLDCRQALILFQLCTGHISLNQHLFHNHKSETLVCPNCQRLTVEVVKYFILECPQYQQECHMLKRKLCHDIDSVPFLLNNPTATLTLLKFIHPTGHFKFQEEPGG